MKHGLIFRIHSIAGLISGVFFLAMSLSGSLLVFHDELDRASFPSIKSLHQAILPVDSCYRSVQSQYPHAQISSCELPGNAKEPFLFSIYDSTYKDGATALQVFLHPKTAKVLGSRKSSDLKDNFMGWLSGFHSSFHLGKTGEWLLGFFSLVFLLSIVTGLTLYRKNVWGVLTFRKSFFKNSGLHQVIGVYALLFNLMIGITGFWMQRYVFKKAFYSSDNYTPHLKKSPALFYDVDSSFKKIHDQFPNFSPAVIYFPQTKKSKTAIYGSLSTNSFIHSKKYADVIFLDSAGKISTTAFVKDIDPSSRYDVINAQIHYGQYGGLPIKILYCLFGLSAGLLSITGSILWIKRRRHMMPAKTVHSVDL